MIRMTRTPDKGWSRVSIVKFIVENNVEYYYSTKYSTMNPTIFNNGINIKIAIYFIEYFGMSFL